MSARTFLLFIISTVLLAWVLQGCASKPRKSIEPLQLLQDPLISGGLSPKMIVLPAGDFFMGPTQNEPLQRKSEQPRHKVTIKKPFAISQFEITFAEFDQFVEATGYRKPSDKGWGKTYWGRNNMPLFDVNWHDARQYVKWLSEQTGHIYRLPSEAEWEYAARAGSITVFNTGNCIHTDQANFHGRYEFGDCPLSPDYRGKTTPVGSFAPNAWNIYDVHGNIFEWVNDCWHDNYDGAPDDGSAWMNEGDNVNCDWHVLRGGSWSGRPEDIRSAARSHNDANFKSIFIGFRVVRELE